MDCYQIIDIKTVGQSVSGDCSGKLSFFESLYDIPFEVKRFYYVTGVDKGVVRGYHAHKNLKQLIFCPFGMIKLKLQDRENNCEVLLDSPSKGVLLDHPVWREMEWLQKDSVLCVAASAYFDEKDYIRNYDEFIKYISGEIL